MSSGLACRIISFLPCFFLSDSLRPAEREDCIISADSGEFFVARGYLIPVMNVFAIICPEAYARLCIYCKGGELQ